MHPHRKHLQLPLFLLGVAALAYSFLCLSRGGAAAFLQQQLHGRREALTAQAYSALMREIENISRSIVSVESQADVLNRDIEELKMSARTILRRQQQLAVGRTGNETER